MRRAFAVILVLSACGGDDDGDDGASSVDAGGGSLADAGALPDAATPDGDAGALPDAAAGSDAGSLPDGGTGADAAPSGMVIESIRVDGDFIQVRQGSEVDVVVTGSGLAGVTAVALGDDFLIYLETLVVSDGQVAFTMWVSDAAAPGPADLTLTGAEGSATAAIPVTPWVVDVAAGPDGRGTYESPMSLCDEELAYASSGARVELSAGEHVCPYVSIGPVSEIVGRGVEETIVRAAGLYVEGFSTTTLTVRDLRLIGDGAAPDAMVMGGSTALLDLAVEGLGLVVRGAENQVSMERVQVAGRAGADCVSVDRFASLSMSDVELSGCRHGVAIPRGNLELTRAAITGCEVGVFLGSPPVVPPEIDILNAALSEVELIDNQVGLRQLFGIASATDVAIHGATMGPVPAEVGISMGGGYTQAAGLVIEGVRHGIELHPISGGDEEFHVSMAVDASVIDGGEVGIDARGVSAGASLWLNESTVRDQTEAAVRIDVQDDSFIDLTDNELSVVGGYALDDARTDVWVPGETIDAPGTTLNGNSYEGQLVQGPVAIGADLRVASDDAFVQF